MAGLGQDGLRYARQKRSLEEVEEGGAAGEVELGCKSSCDQQESSWVGDQVLEMAPFKQKGISCPALYLTGDSFPLSPSLYSFGVLLREAANNSQYSVSAHYG